MKDNLDSLSDSELQALWLQKNANKVTEPQDNLDSLSDEELQNLWLQKNSTSQKGRESEALLQGFGQAGTLGYLPQIQAGAQRAVESIASFIPGTDAYETQKLREQGFNIPEQDYTQARDQFAQYQQQLERENPKSYTAGQVAGGLASSIGAAPMAGASTIAKIGQAAKTGAAYGFLKNPGETEGDISPLQIEERLKNASIDAVFGAAGQGVLSGASMAASKVKELPTTLKRYAELKSLKSAGAMLKDFRKAFGNKKAYQLGREVLDSGIVASGDDIADIAKKAEIARVASGNKISSIYDKADNVIGTKFDPNEIKDIVLNYSVEASDRLKGRIDQAEISQKMQGILDEIASNPSPTFKELKTLRQSIDDQINYSRATNDMPMYQSELVALRNKIQEGVKNKLQKVNPKLAKDLVKENKSYSNLAEISKMAKDKAAREESNSAFGLRERISGGVGATIGATMGGAPGAIIGGAVGAITTKVARQYGTPLVAKVADKAARTLEKNPQLLGEFAQPLLKAASENPEAFVKIISKLRTDPKFQKRLYSDQN